MAPVRTLSQDETHAIWAAGCTRWAALEPAQKRAFDASAGALHNAKRARLEEDKGKVRSDLALTLMRSAQERFFLLMRSTLRRCAEQIFVLQADRGTEAEAATPF